VTARGGGPERTRYPTPGEAVEITKHLVAATAIVVGPSGRVLMHRRSDNGLWGLPGGAVEAGESVGEAAEREVLEETGVTVRALRFAGVDSGRERMQVVSYPDGHVVSYVSVTVECEAVSGAAAVSPDGGETEAVGWFAVSLNGEGGVAGVPGVMVPPHEIRLADWLAWRDGGGDGALLR